MQSLASDDRDALFGCRGRATGRRENAALHKGLPELSSLAADEALVVEVSKKLGQSAPHGQGIQTLGPADAPMYRLRGKFRAQIAGAGRKSDRPAKSHRALDQGI